MQKITLTRSIISNKAILGIMTLNEGNSEICRTLENPYINNQPYISCIPKGNYTCKSYSSTKYPNVWELQDVEGRSKILIHNGNYERNTKGCILVGRNWVFMNNELAINYSKQTLNSLQNILDNEFIIDIVDIKILKII